MLTTVGFPFLALSLSRYALGKGPSPKSVAVRDTERARAGLPVTIVILITTWKLDYLLGRIFFVQVILTEEY